MKILVTGSNGQLGSEIREISSDYMLMNCFFTDLTDLDICDFAKLQSYIIKNNITTVINCAAYTDVDKAEDDLEAAKEVNIYGVQNLVKALKKVNGKLIHISTDYVFNGENSIPYKESDIVSPIGVYGKTKRNGELAVINSDIDAIVIRTSWIYSCYGNNFFKTMIKLGTEKKSISVICDQIGTPTYARDLAKTCLDILTKKKPLEISKNGKLYHYSNDGVVSWYDFSVAIMELGLIDCKINPVLTKNYLTNSKRPLYSVLSKAKIKKDFNLEIPNWKDSLKDCIFKLNKKL